MKKILYISLVLALASCAREHFDPQPLETNVLRASLVREKGTLTKTQTLDNPGIRMETRWADGDQIGVWGSESGDNVLYEVEPAFPTAVAAPCFMGKKTFPRVNSRRFTPIRKTPSFPESPFKFPSRPARCSRATTASLRRTRPL